jgi:hypothetical protein
MPQPPRPSARLRRIPMNAITRRMDRRQDLLRLILPMREAGGVPLADGSKVQAEPSRGGQNETKLAELAQRHQAERWATDLDAVLSDPDVESAVDAALTIVRADTLAKAMKTGKHGEDYSYVQLVHGEGRHDSDALLGSFAAICPASAALMAYAAGDPGRGGCLLESTQKLGRHNFSAPTYYYKTGIPFPTCLNGRQGGFATVGGLQSGRPLRHLVTTFELAHPAGMLLDPDQPAHRMRTLLAVHGSAA